jgi:hypothetical protein
MAQAIPIITAIAGVGSAVGGIISATQKPDVPKAPQVLNKDAISAQRRRAAAATGRSSTILAGQRLGTPGNI